MTRFLKVDESRFPLVTFTLTGPMDDAEFERFLARVSEHLERRTKVAYAFHFAHSQRLPKGRVTRHAEFMKLHNAAFAAHCLGIGLVFGSPVFRFAMSTLLLIQPLPMPYEVCSEMSHAIAFAERRLALAGVSFPTAR